MSKVLLLLLLLLLWLMLGGIGFVAVIGMDAMIHRERFDEMFMLFKDLIRKLKVKKFNQTKD